MVTVPNPDPTLLWKAVSIVPSELSKSTCGALTPLNEVNVPTSAILPSGLTVIPLGEATPLNEVPILVLNVASNVPSMLNFANLFTVVVL